MPLLACPAVAPKAQPSFVEPQPQDVKTLKNYYNLTSGLLIVVPESKHGLIFGCSANGGRSHSGRAFGNSYSSPFCQAMPSVLGATDLGLTRSVLPASCIATITRQIPSLSVPPARFSICCSMGGTALLISKKRRHGPGGAQVRGTRESIRDDFRELV